VFRLKIKADQRLFITCGKTLVATGFLQVREFEIGSKCQGILKNIEEIRENGSGVREIG